MAKIIILFFICLYSLIFPKEAHAYIDPGTGSYVFQLIIASLVGGLFVIKLFWHKISTFFQSLFFQKNKDGENED